MIPLATEKLKNEGRYGGLDALRAFCMFLGIALHGAMGYMQYPYAIAVKDPYYQSVGYDFLFFVIHAFRMQLFYIISGLFFRLLYNRIGEKAFITHRAKRILLPFIIGLFTILPLTFLPGVVYDVTDAGAHFNLADLMQIIRNIFIWRGPLHLWFLFYLVLFFGIGICCKRLVRPWLTKHRFIGGIIQLDLPVTLVLPVIICLSFLTLCLFSTPYVYSSPGLMPKLSFMAYYGFFFYLGWLLHEKRAQYFEILKKAGGWLTASGMLLTGLAFLGALKFHEGGGPSGIVSMLPFKLLMSAATVTLSAGILGLFLKWIREENATLRYLSDSSYWVYLIHVSLVNAMQLCLAATTIWGPLKFLLVVVVTLVVSLGTYQWFVRYTIIGYYLHGSRRRKAELA